MNEVFISVIIPAYNEENRIGKTLVKIRDFLYSKGLSFEVIVVDDGSQDKTAEVVERFKPAISSLQIIKMPFNQGKGFAVKQGFLASQGEYVLFTDADLSTPIEELEAFLRYRKDFDIIIASRAVKGSQLIKRQPLIREYLGRFFNVLVRLMLMPDFRDTQCGFKLFTRDVCRSIFENLHTKGFAFDLEVLARAKHNGLKVKEQPVKWLNNRYSKVSFLSAAFMLFSLFKITVLFKLKKI